MRDGRPQRGKSAGCANDEGKKPLRGWFRNDDLQLYNPVDVPIKGKERFVIDRLIKPLLRTVKGKPTQMYEVKWAGYKEHTVDRPWGEIPGGCLATHYPGQW